MDTDLGVFGYRDGDGQTARELIANSDTTAEGGLRWPTAMIAVAVSSVSILWMGGTAPEQRCLRGGL
jgi:hypothetical protein